MVDTDGYLPDPSFLFASALGKKEYITHLIKLLGKQIDSTLAQLGKTSIDSLTKDVIFGNDTYN